MERVWGGGYWRSSSQCGTGDAGEAGGSREQVRGQEAVGRARKVGVGFLSSVVLLDVKEGQRCTSSSLKRALPQRWGNNPRRNGPSDGASSHPSGSDSHVGARVLQGGRSFLSLFFLPYSFPPH